MSTFSIFLVLIVVVAFLLVVVIMVQNPKGGGDFVLINAFIMQIFLPLNFLGFVYREIKGSLANIEHLFSLMSIKPKIFDADNAEELNVLSGKIDFNNINFCYNKKRQIISNVSFSVNAGEKIAIVAIMQSQK